MFKVFDVAAKTGWLTTFIGAASVSPNVRENLRFMETERRYSLRDDQWEPLQALGLPGEQDHVGVTAKDTRLFVEAVLYRFRAGSGSPCV